MAEIQDEKIEASFDEADSLPKAEESGLVESEVVDEREGSTLESADRVESAREAVEAAAPVQLTRSERLEQERRARLDNKLPEISPRQQQRLQQLRWKTEAKPGWDRLRHPIRNFRALFRIIGAQRRGDWDPAASFDEKVSPRSTNRDRLR